MNLPPELLAHIAGDCDHASQKQLRLVDHVFEDLCSPLVFAHFYMAMFEDSLARLEDLATSRLAKHVKRLTYFTDTLPKLSQRQYLRRIDFRLDFYKWRLEHADEFPDEPKVMPYESFTGVYVRAWRAWEAEPKHTLTKRQLERGWRKYQRLFREQKSWKDNVQHYRFRRHFNMLPNVVETDAFRVMAENTSTRDWPVWKRMHLEMLTGPDDWQERKNTPPETLEFPVLEQGVLTLLEAVAERNRSPSGMKPISTIRIQNKHSMPSSITSNWTNSLYGSATSSTEFAKHHSGPLPLAKAFEHMTVITIHVDFTYDRYMMSVVPMCAQIHHFLLGSRNLKRLNLLIGSYNLFDDDVDGWGGQEPAVNIFDTPTAIWPHVEHIALSATLRTTKLLPFLELHARTLRSLTLREMRVDDVPGLLSKIPKILNLDEVYIDSIWHPGAGLPHDRDDRESACLLSHGTEFAAPYESAMKDYLLGRSDEMPDLIHDDLGELDANSRTDRTGPPPITVFGPRRHDEYKGSLVEF